MKSNDSVTVDIFTRIYESLVRERYFNKPIFDASCIRELRTYIINPCSDLLFLGGSTRGREQVKEEIFIIETPTVPS